MIHSDEDIPTPAKSFIFKHMLFGCSQNYCYSSFLSLLDKIESFKNTFFCCTFSCWYDKKLAVALKFKGNQKYKLKFRNNTARTKRMKSTLLVKFVQIRSRKSGSNNFMDMNFMQRICTPGSKEFYQKVQNIHISSFCVYKNQNDIFMKTVCRIYKCYLVILKNK